MIIATFALHCCDCWSPAVSQLRFLPAMAAVSASRRARTPGPRHRPQRLRHSKSVDDDGLLASPSRSRLHGDGTRVPRRLAPVLSPVSVGSSGRRVRRRPGTGHATSRSGKRRPSTSSSRASTQGAGAFQLTQTDVEMTPNRRTSGGRVASASALATSSPFRYAPGRLRCIRCLLLTCLCSGVDDISAKLRELHGDWSLRYSPKAAGGSTTSVRHLFPLDSGYGNSPSRGDAPGYVRSSTTARSDLTAGRRFELRCNGMKT